MLGWKVLEDPAYNSDIVPFDYHLFRSMQNALSDARFKTFEKAEKWVYDFIAFFTIGIRKLFDRWRKSSGEYFND